MLAPVLHVIGGPLITRDTEIERENLRERIIKLGVEIKPAPAIPEEVERQMAHGMAAIKAANNPAGCRKSIFGPREHRWFLRVAQQSTLPQDAQKGRQQGRSERRSEGVPLWYVEGLSDARTTLAVFFSILR